jgi:hypothetical protein
VKPIKKNKLPKENIVKKKILNLIKKKITNKDNKYIINPPILNIGVL